MPNGRCRMHRGGSTGPKTPNTARNALKHGIYASFLTDEELELAQQIKLGSLEDELRLARIRLRRAPLSCRSSSCTSTNFQTRGPRLAGAPSAP
jgi:hypothetical protein